MSETWRHSGSPSKLPAGLWQTSRSGKGLLEHRRHTTHRHLTELIARVLAATGIAAQHCMFEQVVDVALCCGNGNLREQCPFLCRELSFKAIEIAVEYILLPFVERNTGMPLPEIPFT